METLCRHIAAKDRLSNSFDPSQSRTRSAELTTLQGLRGASALMVVLFHATGMARSLPSLFRYMFGWGYCGVDFFFVLSGFILLYVHYGQIGHPESLKRYFGKRFARIFPVYWAVLAFVVPTSLLVGGIVSPGKRHLGYIIASFFLLPQWDPFLGVAWSLSCEIFFYLIFALLLFNRKTFIGVTVLWLALITANLLHTLPAPLDFLCQARVIEFLAGMCIAWSVRRGFHFSPLWSLALIATGAGICVAAGGTQIARNLSGIVYPLWFGLSAVLILSSLVSLELCSLASAGRVWLLLGAASYSIYLVHYPILIAMFKILPHGAPLYSKWLIAILAAVCSGIAFHLLIEKRVCSFARRLVEPKPEVLESAVLAIQAIS